MSEHQTRLAILANGESYHVQKWAQALVSQGLDVTLLTFHPPSHSLDGVSIRPLLPVLSRSAERMSLIDFRLHARRLRRALADIRADVLLASYATNYGWMASAAGFHPTILQTWTYDVSVYPVSSWKRFVFAPIVRRALRHADLVTTDGAPLADFIRERYQITPDKVIPLLWGIRVDDFVAPSEVRATARAALDIDDGAPVVLAHRGALDWYRPVCVADALLALLEADAGAHAIMLTLEHDRTPEAGERLDRLDGHPRGHVIDRFLTPGQMRDIWAAADISISVPPHDGISVSALEGMASGVVPIVSDIGSNRAIFDDERACFVRDAEADLADAIRDVVSDLAGWRKRVVDTNRDWVRKNGSVETAASQLAAIVRDLAGQREADHRIA